MIDHAVGAVVAVLNGISDEKAVFVDYSIVNAPCVNADRGKTAGFVRLYKSSLDLAEKREDIPVKRTVYRNSAVFEAVNLFCRDYLFGAVKFREYGTSARSSEVEAENALIHLLQRPSSAEYWRI